MTADTHARLVELLQRPDPPELKNRGHRLTQPGKGAKTQRRIWLRYAVTFDAYRRFELDEQQVTHG